MSERFEAVLQLELDLSKETDRGCALMAAEFCSLQLRDLLAAVFVDDKKAVSKALDDAYGSLNTFSSRIEFAYLMGLLSATARRELRLVKSIRNIFAHEHKLITFEDERIAGRCRELVGHNLWPVASLRRNFVRNVMGLLAVLDVARIRAQHVLIANEAVHKPSPEESQKILEGIDAISEAFKKDLSQVPDELSEATIDELRVCAMRAVFDLVKKHCHERKSEADGPQIE